MAKKSANIEELGEELQQPPAKAEKKARNVKAEKTPKAEKPVGFGPKEIAEFAGTTPALVRKALRKVAKVSRSSRDRWSYDSLDNPDVQAAIANLKADAQPKGNGKPAGNGKRPKSEGEKGAAKNVKKAAKAAAKAKSKARKTTTK